MLSAKELQSIKLNLNEIMLLKWLLDECRDIGNNQPYPSSSSSLKLLPFGYSVHIKTLNSLVLKGAVSLSKDNNDKWNYLLAHEAIDTLERNYDIFESSNTNLAELKIDIAY